jgi:2-oxoglutarate dehydrogenase E1 component
LEAKDPAVLEMTRAIKGDAAFANQGVVYENMALHNLTVPAGIGTTLIIVNNQIGSTLVCCIPLIPPNNARPIYSPTLHVNGDDIEAAS